MKIKRHSLWNLLGLCSAIWGLVVYGPIYAATYYMDYENGDDAETGADWAHAWKTITLGATAARIAPGDTIRMAKSPDPTSIGNALWTGGSRNVVLSAACTMMIYSCENSESTAIWKPSANVTTAAYAGSKLGTDSAQISFGADFTTGLGAVANFGADKDLSAYEQVSLRFRSTWALTASQIAVVMYSDDNYPPTTMVEKFYLPAQTEDNYWYTYTYDKGAALSSAVRQIAICADTDPGAKTIYLDCIIACKDSDDADSLTLDSLISKDTEHEPWFGIDWINGTSVGLMSPLKYGDSANDGCYAGTTETVATYKREAIKVSMAAASTTVVRDVTDSGTSGNPITFEGGYNTSSSVIDGITFFDGQNYLGRALRLDGKDYVTVKNLGFFRYYTGLYLIGTIDGLTVDVFYAIASLSRLISASGTIGDFACSNLYGSGMADSGMVLALGSRSGLSTFDNCYIHGCSDEAIDIVSAGSVVFDDCFAGASNGNRCWRVASVGRYGKFINCSTKGFGFQLSGIGFYESRARNRRSLLFYNFQSSGNTGSDVYLYDTSKACFYNSTFSSATEVDKAYSEYSSNVYSTDHDGTPGLNKCFTMYGTVQSTQAVRHTASGWAWQISPNDTDADELIPCRIDITKVALTSGVTTTVAMWARRDDTGLTLKLVCPRGQLAGIVAADVSDSMTAAADTWEQLSIALTPTMDGVVTLQVQAYGGTTYNGYFDDLEVDTTKAFTGLDVGTGEGPVQINYPTAGGSSAFSYGVSE